jgi:outer membrane cobalamin receptor
MRPCTDLAVKSQPTLKSGKTDKGYPYVEYGSKLIQKDRHGNWNAFIHYVVKDSFRDLFYALEFLGVELDTKKQFDAFAKEHTSIWRELMRGTLDYFNPLQPCQAK